MRPCAHPARPEAEGGPDLPLGLLRSNRDRTWPLTSDYGTKVLSVSQIDAMSESLWGLASCLGYDIASSEGGAATWIETGAGLS